MNNDLTSQFHDDEVDWLRREADAADEQAELYKAERDHYKERADHLLQDRNRLQAALQEIASAGVMAGMAWCQQVAERALEGEA